MFQTKDMILTNLEGNWGFKRFGRDGHGCVLEPKGQTFYAKGVTKKFEGVESEWPLFHAFMVIDGIFKNLDEQVDKHQRMLKHLIKYSDKGDPILPMYYYVTSDTIQDEKKLRGSQYRLPR